jgi:hypothetical protein
MNAPLLFVARRSLLLLVLVFTASMCSGPTSAVAATLTHEVAATR